jgi:hypothetical protein
MAFLTPIVPLTNFAVSFALYALALDSQQRKWICVALMLCFQYLILATLNYWPTVGIRFFGLSWRVSGLPIPFHAVHGRSRSCRGRW